MILPFLISVSFKINPTLEDLVKRIILTKIEILPSHFLSFFFSLTAHEYQMLLEERQNISAPYLKLLFPYNFYSLFWGVTLWLLV